MLEVKQQDYTELTEDEQENVPNNGSGKEYATYLRVLYKGESIRLESDAMEPEDTTFYRNLGWIAEAILEAYHLGQHEQTLNKEDQ